jgi:[CysO sulfur-carrier protein]-S-L-cysteine hydrolase
MRISDCGMSTENVAANNMLVIKHADMQRILEHCDREYPNEACGILGGRAGKVEKVFSMTNKRPSPHYYEMDTEQQFQVMKNIRLAGLEMVGIYHSHTGGPAYPSSVDVERAYWPGTALPNYPEACYLIVTLLDRKKPAARVFTIAEKKVVEAGLLIASEENSR